MLHLLDDSLEAFLRAEVPLPSRQVDVSFVAPDSEWGAGITKPTVNLFLWDLRVNTSERHSGMETIEDEEGRKFRRPPHPRVDCRYLVTAWTNEVIDEHNLLGSLLISLLRHSSIAEEHLQGAYAPVRPIPKISVAQPGDEQSPDLWSALGGQLKPGLDLKITATLDLALLKETGPPVERYQLDLLDSTNGDRVSRVTSVGGTAADGTPEGTLVRSPRGRAAVDEEGRFLVRGDEDDEVVVETETAQTGQVGASGAVEFKKRSSRKR